jgi:hypothetical protein
LQGQVKSDDLAPWALKRLPAKNTLTANDAGAVEQAYRSALEASDRDVVDELSEPPSDQSAPTNPERLAACKNHLLADNCLGVGAEKSASRYG